MWPALPPSLPADAAEVEAARLDLDTTGGTADDLKLVLDGWSWRVRRARWPTESVACRAAFRFEGVVGSGAELETAAESVEFCPDHSAIWRALTVTGPRFTLAAATGIWGPGPTGARLSAADATLTRCLCDAPPWVVHADTLTIADPATAWASWPTLRLSGVPVMTVPVWEFPLDARRAGLLWPELAWRGEDGPAGRLPVFIPLGKSADLTPAPGYEAGAGVTGALRLRWQTEPEQGGEARVTADARGFDVTAAGGTELGATQWAVDGRLVSTEPLYAAHARAPATAFAPVTVLRTGITVPGERVYAALHVPVAQDRRTDTRTWTPAVSMGVGGAAGPVLVEADVEEWVQQGDGSDASRLRARAAAAAAGWFGPVRAQLQLSEVTIAQAVGDAGSTRLVGVVQGQAGSAVQRRALGAVHRIDLEAHAALARTGVQGDAPETRDPPNEARDITALWWTLSTQLTGSEFDAVLVSSWGRDAEVADEPWPWATTRITAPWLTVEAAWADGDAFHGVTRAGPDVLSPRLGYARFGSKGAGPLARVAAPGASQGVLGDDGVGETLIPGFAMILGSLTASGDVVLGFSPSRFIGYVGDVRWAGRCQCWHAGVHVEQAHPAPWPDAYLTVSLD